MRHQEHASLYQNQRHRSQPVLRGRPYNNNAIRRHSERHPRIVICVTQPTWPRPPDHHHPLPNSLAANNPPGNLKQHVANPETQRGRRRECHLHGTGLQFSLSQGRGGCNRGGPGKQRRGAAALPHPLGRSLGWAATGVGTNCVDFVRHGSLVVRFTLWWRGSDWGGDVVVVGGGLSGWEGCLDAGWRHWLADGLRWIMEWMGEVDGGGGSGPRTKLGSVRLHGTCFALSRAGACI